MCGGHVFYPGIVHTLYFLLQVSAQLEGAESLGQRMTSVRYSPLKAALLGTACESGRLTFWDCNTNKKAYSAAEHMSPCTGLTFSPVHEEIVASCGLDKRLICYDLKLRYL